MINKNKPYKLRFILYAGRLDQYCELFIDILIKKLLKYKGE